MSVAFESRTLLPTSAYSSPGENRDHNVAGFNPLNPNRDPTLISSSPPTPSTSSLAPTTPPDRHESPPTTAETKAGAPKPVQRRMSPIPKPQRQVVKNREGKFICTWDNCAAAVKEFSRKCEWNKHMDKHERPYKCPADGCENVPGFTYPGGLLRHEREVHHKHGGPKNPLYCPHNGCKRHKNSSFARLENLNEHLRRCHTPSEFKTPAQNEDPDASSRINPLSVAASPLSVEIPVPTMAGRRTGKKRKADEDDLLEENKLLRFDNQELRRKIEAGYLQQSAMMEQIDTLEKEKAALLDRLKDVELAGQPTSIL